MKIYRDINFFEKNKLSVVTIGTFDGIHLGHQKIINRLIEITKAGNFESVVITFEPHPRIVLGHDVEQFKFINIQNEKIEHFRKLGIDNLIIIQFTKEFSQLSSKDFIKNYLIDKIGLHKLIVGYDHQFGKKREGDYENLKLLMNQYKFDVEKIPAKEINNIAVSSTKIRKALEAGNIALANSFLGYEYSITGKVESGNKIGSKIGFPTANIKVEDKYKLIPQNGVYAVKALFEGKIYKGMLNIGKRPTLNLNKVLIEINIFNFDENIYDKTLTIFFVERIRDEIKFQNIENLKNRLIVDEKDAKKILKTDKLK